MRSGAWSAFPVPGREVGEEPEAEAPALLGVELRGDDVVARDDGAELDAVLASPERVRVHTRVGVIGVDEVVVAPVGEPAGDRVPASEAHLVPADLGDALAVGEATDPAGKPAEARGASFLAVLEEHL